MLKLSVEKNLKPLEDLARRAKELDGQHSVPIADLLSIQFVSGCSQFKSAADMFERSGFHIESMEDFKAIPDDQWDAFIASNTTFPDWITMLNAAMRAWTKARLGL